MCGFSVFGGLATWISRQMETHKLVALEAAASPETDVCPAPGASYFAARLLTGYLVLANLVAWRFRIPNLGGPRPLDVMFQYPGHVATEDPVFGRIRGLSALDVD